MPMFPGGSKSEKPLKQTAHSLNRGLFALIGICYKI